MTEAMDPAEIMEAEEIARYRIINETIAHGDSRVQQFYAGAVVLVTGGSGFLGKQLIEKLFRSAKIKKVYMLLRQKKEKKIEERLAKLFQEPLFDYLNKTQPNFAEKIVPITGDVTKLKMGISDEDWKIITEEVTIIVHGAATISFTEPIKVAAVTNVRGTREMVKLAKDCKRLKSYVHISTAYAHATYQRIKKPVLEEFYESPMAPEVLLQLVDSLSEDKLDAMTPALIEGWPNTYSFTKAIAEEVVRTMAADLPVCIVRPAIVICSKCEPIPGWLDISCVFGASGLVVGSGLGVIHTLHLTHDINLDLVPVDVVNNAIIAAAHATVERRERGETDIQIYTVTGTRDPVTMGGMIDYIVSARFDVASAKAVWLGSVMLTNNKYLHFLLSWLFHYIPGYLVDGVLKVLGKKPMLIKVYNKMNKLNAVLKYFMNNDWLFDDSNLMKLYWSLSPSDRIIYNCNMVPMDWARYFVLWCIGCRKYIIKDGLKGTTTGIKKQKLFWVLNLLVLCFYVYMLYLVVYYLFYGLASLISIKVSN